MRPDPDNTTKNALLVEDLEVKYQQANERYRKIVADAEMSLAFLSGNQWIEYSWSKGLLPVGNDSGERRETDNRMENAFHRWFHEKFKEKPVITCFEGGAELRDAESAAAASAMCDYWESNNGWRQARQCQVSWAAVAGVGYVAPLWKQNRRSPGVRKTFEMSDKPVEGSGGGLTFVLEREVSDYPADVAFEFYNPLQTYLFPLDVSTWDKVEGILTADVVTYDWLDANLDMDEPEEALQPIDGKGVNREALERINRFVSADFGLSAIPKTDEKRYLILQWFERPTRTHPDGRYVLSVGGEILKDESLPYVKEARSVDPGDNYNITMGIIPYFPKVFPGRLIPPSPVGGWREPQIRLNELLTDQKRNRDTVGRNFLLYDKDGLPEDAFGDSYGETIGLDAATNDFTPQFIQGHPLIGIEAELNRAAMNFNDQTGQTEVRQGRNPTQARAAFQLDILLEQSMQLTNAEVDQLELCYEMQTRLVLAIAKARYSPERIVQIVGRDRTNQGLMFTKAVINTDIRIQKGSMRPRNHALREAKLWEMFEKGAFIDKASGKPDTELFLSLIELGSMNRSMSPSQRQKKRALEEDVRMLLYKEPIKPFDHEDQNIHIETHRASMARPEWYDAGDDVKALMIAHIEAHRDIEAEQAAPGAFMDTDPVAGLVPELSGGARQGAPMMPAAPEAGMQTGTGTGAM